MNPKKKEKQKKKIEKEVVQWRHMKEARRLEAQVMAGGEGLQANQVGGDRSRFGAECEKVTKRVGEGKETCG